MVKDLYGFGFTYVSTLILPPFIVVSSSDLLNDLLDLRDFGLVLFELVFFLVLGRNSCFTFEPAFISAQLPKNCPQLCFFSRGKKQRW